jgi:phage terminase large subunit
MRTEDKLFFDFNPSDNYHWLYNLIDNEDSIKIHSTYKDNPFLPDSIIKQIEGLIEVDESYYKIYALGERSVGKTTIYTHWKYYDDEPETTDVIYGLDPGFNHPLCLVEIRFIDNDVYVKELIYESNLTSSDLLTKLKDLNVSKSIEMIVDYARPEIIEDLKRSGYNAKNAIKDVKPGIDSIKSSKLFINKESVNLIKEINTYKWKTKGDIILDEPVKMFDDGMDAMRYGVHYKKQQIKRNNKNSFRVYY